MLEMYPEPLRSIPIKLSDEVAVKMISREVDKIISKKQIVGHSDMAPNEALLDARIAALYGLTRNEYDIIIGDSHQHEPFRVAALNFFEDFQREKKDEPSP